jgi:hypothetical protein
MFFVWISERTASFALYNINRLVFTTDVESVYCAVRSESLYKTDTVCLIFKGLITTFITTSSNIMNPEKPDERSSYCTSIPLTLSYGKLFSLKYNTLNVIFYTVTLDCVLIFFYCTIVDLLTVLTFSYTSD